MGDKFIPKSLRDKNNLENWKIKEKKEEEISVHLSSQQSPNRKIMFALKEEDEGRFWGLVEECQKTSMFSNCMGVYLNSNPLKRYSLHDKLAIPPGEYSVYFRTSTLKYEELLTIVENAKFNLQKCRPISNESDILANLLIEFTYESVSIEGNTLTIDETKIMAEILSQDPTHDPTNFEEVMGSKREKLEMANHLNLISKFQELIRNKVTEHLILEVHKLLMEGLLDTKQVGTYRTELVGVSNSQVMRPVPKEVPDMMKNLFEKIEIGPREGQHIVEYICDIFCEFQRIHPFRDGNGRVGRLIVNFLLSQAGYPIISTPPSLKVIYCEAIEKYFLKDFGLFKRFILECLFRSFQIYEHTLNTLLIDFG